LLHSHFEFVGARLDGIRDREYRECSRSRVPRVFAIASIVAEIAPEKHQMWAPRSVSNVFYRVQIWRVRGGPRPGSATLDTLPTDKFHARLIDRLVRARFSFF
jgi:hypothetical protein